jgi:hypothetical protein
MRKEVLLLNGCGGQVHGWRWYRQLTVHEKAAWQTSVDYVFSGLQVYSCSRISLERQPSPS